MPLNRHSPRINLTIDPIANLHFKKLKSNGPSFKDIFRRCYLWGVIADLQGIGEHSKRVWHNTFA